ncbi:calcium proton exchanger [Cristinia sonorae]|uniref:Calcium proton exchanger n=1 Tax=Cristinia sonorae TaxID=1940300 RepID=A0A8K0UMQ6_9AGAR|nr:calcium proton exchanger [Cristinia sonorae]
MSADGTATASTSHATTLTHRAIAEAHKEPNDSAPYSSPTSNHSTARASTGGTNPARSVFRAISRTLTANMQPEREIGAAPTFMQSIMAVVRHSYLNILCLFIPVSWILHFVLPENSKNDTIIFVCSFIAIIPLAKLLAFATDQLSMRVGQTLAGLLNATLGNAVELIVSIIALLKCDLQVVQSSLIGSILSNILLVLGMCFFAGGVRFSEQGFGVSPVQLNASLLTVSVIAILLPAAFHFLVDPTTTDSIENSKILSVSHASALILLFIYCLYLVFQLRSHKRLYNDEDPGVDAPKTVKYDPGEKSVGRITKYLRGSRGGIGAAPADGIFRTATGEPVAPRSESPVDDTNEATATADIESAPHPPHPAVEIPEMNLIVTLGLLVFDTVLVAVTAEFLVDSINGLVEGGGISREFVGLILLPIVGNAAEHATAVAVSVKDKLTLSLGVAVGSSIQIALFVIPFIVTLSWIIGKPLTMLFDPLESLSMFFAVLVVNYTTQDGKSNWLEGAILMLLYVILATMFWFYPGVDVSKDLLHFDLTSC